MENIALLEKISELYIKISKLEERVSQLESNENVTGVYIGGMPEYAQEYVKVELKKGVESKGE